MLPYFVYDLYVYTAIRPASTIPTDLNTNGEDTVTFISLHRVSAKYQPLC